jgi:hypothetical protein
LRVLVRYFVLVPAAYVAACVAGGFVSAVGLGVEGEGPVVPTALVYASYGGLLFVWPAVVFIFVTEAVLLRSIIVWLVTGVTIGLILLIGALVAASANLTGSQSAVLMLSGFVGALVYWAIAGRSAGVPRANTA